MSAFHTVHCISDVDINGKLIIYFPIFKNLVAKYIMLPYRFGEVDSLIPTSVS